MDRPSRPLTNLGLGGPQSVVGQLAGADGEVHRGQHAVVGTQRETIAVEDVDDGPGAAHEAEHLGEVHGVAPAHR
jgi:hypothetical protein